MITANQTKVERMIQRFMEKSEKVTKNPYMNPYNTNKFYAYVTYIAKLQTYPRHAERVLNCQRH